MCPHVSIVLIPTISIIILFLVGSIYDDFELGAKGEGNADDQEQPEPIVNDPNLKLKIISEGLLSHSSFAILGPDDILLLEKGTGKVRRIIDGELT